MTARLQPKPAADGGPSGGGTSFSTTSAPLHLHDALDHLLLHPAALLADVLSYAGPAGVAKLRNFPVLRGRISLLSPAELVRVGLPPDSNPSGADIQFLRSSLLECDWEGRQQKQGRNEGVDDGGERVASLHYVRLKPRRKRWRLNRLGMLALAQSPLASDLALRNLCLCSLSPEKAARANDDEVARARRQILEAVASNPSASSEILKLILQLVRKQKGFCGSCDSYVRVLRSVASHGSATPDMLDSLALSDPALDQSVVAEAARNPNTKKETLSALITTAFIRDDDDDDEECMTPILIRVAANPNASGPDLARLASHREALVRDAVAQNRSTAPSVLRRLANAPDEEFHVRLSAAANPSTPADCLDALVRGERTDSGWIIRLWVANNPSAAVDTLARLARDDVGHVRRGVANNPAVLATGVFDDVNDPAHWPILGTHSDDPGTLTVLGSMADADEEVQRAVAGNVHSPPDVLALLSRSDRTAVRAEVACNPAAPASVLGTLSRDAMAYIRAYVGGNPSVPRAVLEALAVDADEQVREWVSRNPNASGKILATVVGTVPAGTPDDDDGQYGALLCAVAEHPNAPVDVLVAMSHSELLDVRCSAALNRRLPACHLARLSRDPGDMVRMKLATNTAVQRVADALSCSITLSALR